MSSAIFLFIKNKRSCEACFISFFLLDTVLYHFVGIYLNRVDGVQPLFCEEWEVSEQVSDQGQSESEGRSELLCCCWRFGKKAGECTTTMESPHRDADKRVCGLCVPAVGSRRQTQSFLSSLFSSNHWDSDLSLSTRSRSPKQRSRVAYHIKSCITNRLSIRCCVVFLSVSVGAE